MPRVPSWSTKPDAGKSNYCLQNWGRRSAGRVPVKIPGDRAETVDLPQPWVLPYSHIHRIMVSEFLANEAQIAQTELPLAIAVGSYDVMVEIGGEPADQTAEIRAYAVIGVLGIVVHSSTSESSIFRYFSVTCDLPLLSIRYL